MAVLFGEAVPALRFFVDDVHALDDADFLVLHGALELAQILSELDEQVQQLADPVVDHLVVHRLLRADEQAAQEGDHRSVVDLEAQLCLEGEHLLVVGV